jgi:hypothetical protein
MRRIDDKPTVDSSHSDCADRSGKRNIGDAKGRRRSIDAENIRVIFAIGTQQDANYLRVVEIPLREEWPQRAIRHPRRQRFFLGRTTFALEIPARNLAGRRRFFPIVNGQREEILPLFDRSR